ncbi:hypothetical protein LG322_08700 [Microbacterium aerolatum]|uniref:hypothetical protein n=1 Tax=Microbacterium aerolatum TaxID=153731 RepID=UPI00385001CF
MDPTLLAVLSIFGGVAVTAAAGLLGAWIQGRREHKKWLRERRFEAYTRSYTLLQNWRALKADTDVMIAESKRVEHSTDPADVATRKRVNAELQGVKDRMAVVFADVTECESEMQLLGPASVQHAINALTMGVVQGVDNDTWSDLAMTYAKTTRKVMSIR